MLLVTDDSGVRTLTLNRPDRLNTLTGALMRELHSALLGAGWRRARLLRGI